MLQDFVLIQRKAIDDDFARPESSSQAPQNWFQLKTCMRNILVGPKDEMGIWSLLPTDEIVQEESAYQFLLEVISGLHSSLLGETEILGQFKNAAASFVFPNSHFGFELKKFIQAMLEDVKKVRSKYLADLGSQSYGSLLRKEVKKLSVNEVHIIGAGHLCEEILPWIAKEGTALHIHARNKNTAQKKFKNAKVLLQDLKNGESFAGVVVIAAPMQAFELNKLLAESPNLVHIFDLRHDSDQNPIETSLPIKTLSKFVSVLNENSEQIQERKKLALGLILQMTQSRAQAVEHRPFGWDDMTAGMTAAMKTAITA